MKSEETHPYEDVGARLRAARLAVGLTQEELAARVGVLRRAIYTWERGMRLPAAHMPALARELNVSASYLLHGVEPASVELAQLREQLAAIHADIRANHELLRKLTAADDENGDVTGSSGNPRKKKAMVPLALVLLTLGFSGQAHWCCIQPHLERVTDSIGLVSR